MWQELIKLCLKRSDKANAEAALSDMHEALQSAPESAGLMLKQWWNVYEDMRKKVEGSAKQEEI